MEDPKERATALRKSLKKDMHKRVPSLDETETFILRSLLLDEPSNGRGKVDSNIPNNDNSSSELSDDVLFSLPPVNMTGQQAELPAHHKPAKRWSTLGLWRAHEKGVHPTTLIKQATQAQEAKEEKEDPLKGKEIDTGDSQQEIECIASPEEKQADDESDDAASDVEVRPSSKSDGSEASSWDEEEHRDTYDTWEVLKDEYAGDFGFDYSTRSVSLDAILNDEDAANVFSILGTSADDQSVQPHVLSPPLMDAIANFLPDEVEGENFWLRYSLVRDGASLDTMRSYVRGAKYTIIAIETPKGEVFGSFTSSHWRTNYGYFGGRPSFVWKMRHNRRTKCSSLFEQATLESEIDVYMCSHKKELVQVCRHDQLAVGGDKFGDDACDDFALEGEVDLDQSGFAFSLESDLLIGTTSPCTSFTSPALVGKGNATEVFDVAGLEVWSFTPCFDVASAQKLEMTKYFIEQSVRSSARGSPSTSSTRSSSRSVFSGGDLNSDRFYQRVGQDFESQERRQRWQYTNMMNPVGGVAGVQSSPRFL